MTLSSEAPFGLRNSPSNNAAILYMEKCATHSLSYFNVYRNFRRYTPLPETRLW